MMNNYEETLFYIHSLPRFSGKPSLERICKLLDLLGNPQNNLKFVHVAGTNGKGSTAAMTSEVLRQTGLKTGLFISPYILDFRERIQINGEFIPEDILTRLTNEVSNAVKLINFTADQSVVEFEFITAIALKYFEISHCDIVVLEVGIGGKFDATNIIENPEICVIASISFDHMAILGDTLPKIADEKCGIIKNNTKVVSYPCQTDEVFQTISKNCSKKDAILIIPDLNLLKIESSTILGSKIEYKGLSIDIPLIGEHQIYNTLVVIEILFALREKGWDISDDDIITGIAIVRFPGRLEVKGNRPLILLDGAHNEGGVSALCKALDTYLSDKRIFMILGMVSDKSYENCIIELSKRAYMIFAVQPDNARALDSSILEKIASKQCSRILDEKCVDKAICKAIELANINDVVLVCGSLYLVSDAEKTLQSRHEMS